MEQQRMLLVVCGAMIQQLIQGRACTLQVIRQTSQKPWPMLSACGECCFWLIITEASAALFIVNAMWKPVQLAAMQHITHPASMTCISAAVFACWQLMVLPHDCKRCAVCHAQFTASLAAHVSGSSITLGPFNHSDCIRG